MEIPISQEHKNRLDVEMHVRALSRSRSHAADLIKRGLVMVNGKRADKPSAEISSTDQITLDQIEKFVSRAGEKLSHALEVFNVSPLNLTVLDIGSSTGGFTDCLLQNGAKKVIAVDVGTDQLVSQLKKDSRVELHEGTNIKNFKILDLVDMAVIDVSFVSLTHVLPKAYECMKKGGMVIALVKPQFEVGMEIAKKQRGVITDPSLQNDVLKNVKDASKKIGFKLVSDTTSPIKGEKGNKEFLLLLKK